MPASSDRTKGGPRTFDVMQYSGNVGSPNARPELADVISVDPEVMHGAPCFRGTRVPVQLLLDDFQSGFTIDEFLLGCPSVKREQVESYLSLAQQLVAECVS